MQEVIWYFLGAFAIALLTSPLILYVLRKLKAGQEILSYVDFHNQKRGTPTMGGIIFILPMVILAPIFLRISSPFAIVAVAASLGYGILGFLDDYIKVRTKNNQGLRAYQKIIGQGGIAILVAVFYTMANPDGRVLVPFFNVFLDLGWWIAPLVFVILIATTNSVNLTDGIDGLASTVSLIYFAFVGVLIYLVADFANIPDQRELYLIIAITTGALLCFLMFNSNRAKTFMGDTGSLYLGGLVATVSIFSFMSIFILVLGVMFVLSSLTVIIQVAYFKYTGGKRVFLMTPFHHHLEKRNWGEARIVALYGAVTVVAGLCLVLALL